MDLHLALNRTPSLLQVGWTTWRAHEGVKAAHRPGNAHAKDIGVLVLALTSVPRERAALLGVEAATAHAQA